MNPFERILAIIGALVALIAFALEFRERFGGYFTAPDRTVTPADPATHKKVAAGVALSLACATLWAMS